MLTKEQFEANLAYINNQEEIDFLAITALNVWENKPFSAELESYTDKGGDMLINVEELSQSGLKQAIKDFDINREVIMWWPNGEKGKGVPYKNIKEHYEDIQKWLNKLKKVAKNLPY